MATSKLAARPLALRHKARLNLEALEKREVLYAVSGAAWTQPALVTLSFVPDGTVLASDAGGTKTSDLFAEMNAAFGGPEAGQTYAPWQREIIRAAQVWAQQTNINFRVVSDNGAQIGTGAYQQGDANFGDIRIGGYDFGTTTLAQAYSPPPLNGNSFAGDIQFNTGQTWAINGQTYDLFTVAAHEVGHALGLYHGVSGAAMFGAYEAARTSLAADDIAGIKNVYSGNSARAADGYDAGTGNGSFANATDLTSQIDTTSKTALVTNLDVTTTADADYYKFTVPADLGGTLTAKIQSSGLSLLSPKITLYSYNSSTNTYTSLGTASSTAYGATVTRTATLTAGTTYWVKAEANATNAFGTGRYALALGFAGVAAPTAASPNTQTANTGGSGGGQAVGLGPETRVNTTTAGTQLTEAEYARGTAMASDGSYIVNWTNGTGTAADVYAQRFDAAGNKLSSEFRVNTYTSGAQGASNVAVDSNGNFVIVWASYGQDGSGSGIYAQRYSATGVPQGGEFRVNTRTKDEQNYPVVAMQPNGGFVVTWSSKAQDSASGWGIYAQRYDASGVAQGGEFLVNTKVSNDQIFSDISADGAGNFIITWAAREATFSDIYAQRFSATGVRLGGEFRVNSVTSDNQSYPVVATAANGSFVVSWSSGQVGSRDVYARRFDASGVALGGDFRVNTFTVNDQYHPNVSVSGGGNFFITWDSVGQDSNDGSSGVYAQQFSSTGVPQGNEFRVNTTVAGSQTGSSMALNANGDAVIVWSGNGSGDASGVFAQRYMVSYGGMNPMHAFGPAGHDHDHGDDGDHRESAYALPASPRHDDLAALRRLLASGLPLASGPREGAGSSPRQGRVPTGDTPALAHGTRHTADGTSPLTGAARQGQAARLAQAARRAQRDLLAATDNHTFSTPPV